MDKASAAYQKLRTEFPACCAARARKGESSKRVAAEAGADMDALAADPRVTHLAFTKEVLYTGTRTLLMLNEKTRELRRLGRCIISVGKRGVYCENLDLAATAYPPTVGAKPTRYAHPHVREGEPCFGYESTEDVRMKTWCTDGRLAKAARYMVGYLCLARGGFHYLSPEQWPMTTQKEREEWHALLR